MNMNMDFEDGYLDILQNMEFMTIQVYRQHPDLTDFQVDKAFEGLLRVYQAEKRGKSAPPLKLGPLDQQVYDNVKSVCEFRLGRPSTFEDDLEVLEDAEEMMMLLQDGVDDPELLKEADAIIDLLNLGKEDVVLPEDGEVEIEILEEIEIDVTVDEIIACLKRIRSSISMWTKQSGRQGYLTFADQFQP